MISSCPPRAPPPPRLAAPGGGGPGGGGPRRRLGFLLLLPPARARLLLLRLPALPRSPPGLLLPGAPRVEPLFPRGAPQFPLPAPGASRRSRSCSGRLALLNSPGLGAAARAGGRQHAHVRGRRRRRAHDRLPRRVPLRTAAAAAVRMMHRPRRRRRRSGGAPAPEGGAGPSRETSPRAYPRLYESTAYSGPRTRPRSPHARVPGGVVRAPAREKPPRPRTPPLDPALLEGSSGSGSAAHPPPPRRPPSLSRAGYRYWWCDG